MLDTPRIGLISCGKRKLGHAAAARDLYIGDLFKKSLAYALRTCDEVYILSALHGLLELDTVISPYECTLHRMSKSERAAWASQVRVALPPGTYVYFTGERYREGLPPGETPLLGLSFGRQLRWFKERLHVKSE